MIQAINTKFDGYLFRSRLEARWAVFFNDLSFKYEYEKEGFQLEDGTWYLPDFFLTELYTWVEVKPDKIIDEDRRRALLLSKGIGDGFFVVLVNGLPGPRLFECYCNGESVSECTFSIYIKKKGWTMPFFGEGWENEDYLAFDKAKTARFEFKK